ncbi:hypothetical protein JG688_00014407 [Phytophthora aleatoria]|uniref:Uncharacterized protein n=1 Tax=Phytophthora aleatoria TaxID=2496075 RepID=A0A8J5IVH2_9STRA|nr:hypothetical protein JG688_00014407 [Phytophthora aleatoria]
MGPWTPFISTTTSEFAALLHLPPASAVSSQQSCSPPPNCPPRSLARCTKA